MASLSVILETSKNTLLNTQVSLQTASHNIANADNKAYSRQKVVVQSNLALPIRAGWVGTGASVSKILQQRDQFIEGRLMSSISEKAHWEDFASKLDSINVQMLDDGESGLSESLGSFWDSWDVLLQDPTSLAAKEGVVQASQSVAERLRDNYSHLEAWGESIEQELDRSINDHGDVKSDVNRILDAVASLNEGIRLSERVGGASANDLRDQRYQAVQELAEHIPIRYSEEKDGSWTVALDYKESGVNPVVLVSHNRAGELAYDPEGAGDPSSAMKIEYRSFDYDSLASTGVSIKLDAGDVAGGSLSGLTAARRVVEESLGELNRFGGQFAQAVNGHMAIFSIQDPANAAKDFALDPTFSVAALKTDTKVDPEAISKLSATCLAISKLQEESIAGLDGARFGEFLGNSQHKVGSRQNQAQSKAEFFGSLVSELETQQQSVSGVSLDEEMVEVLKNQQVYQAAAKIIQQTSALLQGVIEMV